MGRLREEALVIQEQFLLFDLLSKLRLFHLLARTVTRRLSAELREAFSRETKMNEVKATTRTIVNLILNVVLANSLNSLFSILPAVTGHWHFRLNMEGRNSQPLDSYLPCPCNVFSQKFATLRLIGAHWGKIEQLLTPPLLRRHPPTPFQVVALCGSPSTRLRTHSAWQKHPK